MFFAIEFLLTIASYQFFANDSIFMNHGLFFRGKYSNFKNKVKKKNTAFEDFLLIYEIRVLNNIFPEKISNDL